MSEPHDPFAAQLEEARQDPEWVAKWWSGRSAGGWQPVETAPYACHVLATRFDADAGEWFCAVVASPPIQPFTHWMPLPNPPTPTA